MDMKCFYGIVGDDGGGVILDNKAESSHYIHNEYFCEVQERSSI